MADDTSARELERMLEPNYAQFQDLADIYHAHEDTNQTIDYSALASTGMTVSGVAALIFAPNEPLLVDGKLLEYFGYFQVYTGAGMLAICAALKISNEVSFRYRRRKWYRQEAGQT